MTEPGSQSAGSGGSSKKDHPSRNTELGNPIKTVK